jgi:hypothetical protein
LDRLGYCIERCLALSRGEPNFEDAFLARQRYRLSELCCGRCSCLGSLRPGRRVVIFNGHQKSEGTDCNQAE